MNFFHCFLKLLVALVKKQIEALGGISKKQIASHSFVASLSFTSKHQAILVANLLGVVFSLHALVVTLPSFVTFYHS